MICKFVWLEIDVRAAQSGGFGIEFLFIRIIKLNQAYFHSLFGLPFHNFYVNSTD